MKRKKWFPRMNNRGFAITSILYTLFILFLMILLSVLGGLRTRKDMLESSTSVLEESFLGSNVKQNDYINYVKQEGKAPVDGKYVFELDDNSQKVMCSTYLHKNDVISNDEREKLNLIPSDCNDYVYTLVFDDSDLQGMKLKLIQVYSFEKE